MSGFDPRPLLGKALDQMGELREFRVLDNNAEHSIERTFFDHGKVTGSLRIEAAALAHACHSGTLAAGKAGGRRCAVTG